MGRLGRIRIRADEESACRRESIPHAGRGGRILTDLVLGYFFSSLDDFIHPEVFAGLDYPWQALAAAKSRLGEIAGAGEPGGLIQCEVPGEAVVRGAVRVGEGTVIDAHVLIEGPAIIGRNVTIRHGALVRPGTIVSDDCVLGHGCEIKNSLLFRGAKVQSLTFCGDSVIGRGARIGSGTITANRRFDQGEIGIKHEGVRHPFDTEYFGCVLGDYVRLGANCVTLPGTLIGPYTWVMPLTRVGGFIPRGKLVSFKHALLMTDNQPRKLKP
ncbi:MAG: hypothetical protein C4551_06080 [Bacillota bacterium]|nr:MAG: hypothetical protein C4551_06080 [Bacillota bacterium]